MFFMALLAISCFAEVRSRVDRYGNIQVKIIWNACSCGGPDNTNWAKGNLNGWASILRYVYLLNPKNTSQHIKRFTISLFTAPDDYGYSYDPNYYKVKAIVETGDGLFEIYAQRSFYYFQYNEAKMYFDSLKELCESLVALDEF